MNTPAFNYDGTTVENPPESTPGADTPVSTPAQTVARATDQRGAKRRATIEIPQVTKADLEPEALVFKLNQILSLLATQLAKGQGNSGPFKFGDGPLTFAGDTYAQGSLNVQKLLRLQGESDRSGNVSPIEFQDDLPIYANNAAAIAGGLTKGRIYMTAAGTLMTVY